jgi:plasmid stabilization system protein ParE
VRRRVQLTANAASQLDALLHTQHLPADTRTRVARILRPLAGFPEMGAALEPGAPSPGLRFILGPWRWMLIIYTILGDRVVVVAIEDGRTSNAATTGRQRP